MGYLMGTQPNGLLHLDLNLEAGGMQGPSDVKRHAGKAVEICKVSAADLRRYFIESTWFRREYAQSESMQDRRSSTLQKRPLIWTMGISVKCQNKRIRRYESMMIDCQG